MATKPRGSLISPAETGGWPPPSTDRRVTMFPMTCPEMTLAVAELVVYAVTTFMAALGLLVTAR